MEPARHVGCGSRSCWPPTSLDSIDVGLIGAPHCCNGRKAAHLYGGELGSLANCSTEHLGEVTGKRLVRAGGIARHLHDVRRREVAVAFAKSCHILTEGIGHPFRQSHADHPFPAGLEWHVYVLDFLAERLR